MLIGHRFTMNKVPDLISCSHTLLKIDFLSVRGHDYLLPLDTKWLLKIILPFPSLYLYIIDRFQRQLILEKYGLMKNPKNY